MARLSTGPEATAPFWHVQLEQQQHAKVDDDSDDDDDDDSDDDDDDDSDDDDSDDDELDEDEAKAELKRIRAALKDANAQGAKRRSSVKTLRAKLAKAERDLAAARVAKPKPKTDDDKGGGAAEVDVEAIKAATKLEVDTAAEVKIKRAEARGALRGAGVKSDLLDKAVRTLDLDDLDVDDDGNVDGLDEAIAELRKSVPSLFGGKPATKRRSVAGPSDRDGERGPKPKKLTTSEIQAKQIRGELR